jgi:CBS domain containing-hemolysin-like protein
MTATAMKGFLILLLIPVNGVLAMVEITVLSARKMRLHSLAFSSERQGLSHRECGGVALLSHVTNHTDVRVQRATLHT